MHELRGYEYDKLGRLTETNIRDKISNTISNTVYTYDKVGNRVKEVKDGKTTTYTYNSLNQLVSSVEVGSEDSAGGSEESSDDEGESHTVLSNKKFALLISPTSKSSLSLQTYPVAQIILMIQMETNLENQIV